MPHIQNILFGAVVLWIVSIGINHIGGLGNLFPWLLDAMIGALIFFFSPIWQAFGGLITAWLLVMLVAAGVLGYLKYLEWTA